MLWGMYLLVFIIFYKIYCFQTLCTIHLLLTTTEAKSRAQLLTQYPNIILQQSRQDPGTTLVRERIFAFTFSLHFFTSSLNILTDESFSGYLPLATLP